MKHDPTKREYGKIIVEIHDEGRRTYLSISHNKGINTTALQVDEIILGMIQSAINEHISAEPLKFNIGVEELEAALAFAKEHDRDGITMKVTPNSVGTGFSVSEKWDSEQKDITDLESW